MKCVKGFQSSCYDFYVRILKSFVPLSNSEKFSLTLFNEVEITARKKLWKSRAEHNWERKSQAVFRKFQKSYLQLGDSWWGLLGLTE